jgi:hypothetical protein
VRSSDGLPVAEPEMLRSPPIRVKADRERLHHRADGVEVTAVSQRFEVRLPVEVHGDGVDDQVELAGQRL